MANRLQGRVAPVHKPLASAASVCDAGADVYLGSDGGYIISGEAKARLRKAFDKIVAEDGYLDLVPVYREDNVYNFYVQVQRMDLAPVDAGMPPAGGRWPAPGQGGCQGL
jgi:hypothetical protein